MAAGTASEKAETRKFRMLVVDDEPENVQYLQRMFRKEYDVDVSTSGTEALSLIEQTAYDVIITDQMMPGMTGTELLTRSLTLAPDAIRILVTGFPDLESAIASINDGKAYRFFTKPIDRRELVGAVNTALDSLKARSVLQTQINAVTRDRDQLRAKFDALQASIEDEVKNRAAAVVEEVVRLRERNPFDEETQLYNRHTLQKRLEEELVRSERYGLLCSYALLRIADFHQLPDPVAAIHRMSELLRLSLRRFDSAGRWAPDTFALVMPHTDLKGAEAAVGRLYTAISEDDAASFTIGGAIAVYPSTGSTADELIAETEKALA